MAGHRAGGGRSALVDSDEIAALEPNLRTPPAQAVFTPTDGALDPVRTTEALVQAAREHGTQVVLGSPVTALRVTNGRVDGVETASEVHPASTVVLAAGAGIPALCEPLGASLPVKASPALLVWASAPPGLVRTIVATAAFEVREVAPGEFRLVADMDPDDPGDPEEHVRRTLSAAADAFGTEFRYLRHRVSRRPMPPGPLVGYVTEDRSVYVAVMHPGVVLAPTAGRLAAEEILTGTAPPELRRCRPPMACGV